MFSRFFSVLFFLLSASGSGQAFTWDTGRQNQLDQFARQYQAQRGQPTIAIAVTVNGATVYTGAIGPGGAAIPNGANIRFRIGSVTKQFTACSILALIEDSEKVPFTGKPLSLDTSLDDYLSNIGQWSTVQPMTIRRLLNMTSNIPSYTADQSAIMIDPNVGFVPGQNPIDRNNMVQRIKTFPLQGPPGAFHYSNSNYFLLSQIVQTTKGANQSSSIPFFHDYVRSRIFGRAGMKSAGFIGEPTPAGVIDAQPIYLSPPFFDKPDWPLGAGDIVASVADMARWNIALMSEVVLSSPSLVTLTNPAAPVSTPGNYTGCAYAMGWFICQLPGGMRRLEHDGEISGFRAYNGIVQAGSSWASVTVLVNSDAAADIAVFGRNILAAMN